MKLLIITLTVLQSLFSTLERQTLYSDFTITVTDNQTANSQPMSYAGRLTMHDQKFSIALFGMEAAYDGSTLYVYTEDSEELTLSTPTEEELLQTNPFLYAKALLPLCEYTEKVIGDNTVITLAPKDQSLGIKKFVLKVLTTPLLPIAAEIHEFDGKQTILKLNHAIYKNECPNFSIEKPEAFINDLR